MVYTEFIRQSAQDTSDEKSGVAPHPGVFILVYCPNGCASRQMRLAFMTKARRSQLDRIGARSIG